MVVSGSDVGGERPKRIEGRLLAIFQLQIHVLFDELHWHVPRAFDHHLHVVLPGDVGEFTEGA